MANLGMTFDPNSVPAADLMPAGVPTLVQIVDSNVVPTNSGNGMILKLNVKVLGGERAGAMHFEQLNIVNPNPTAAGIAQRALKNLCAAIGHHGPLQDSVVLHNKPFLATFKTQPGKDGFEDKSTISKYEPYGGNAAHPQPVQQPQPGYAPQAQQPMQPAAPPPAQPNAPARPWGR